MARFAPGRKAQAARFRSRPDRPRRVPFQDRQSDRQKIGRPHRKATGKRAPHDPSGLRAGRKPSRSRPG